MYIHILGNCLKYISKKSRSSEMLNILSICKHFQIWLKGQKFEGYHPKQNEVKSEVNVDIRRRKKLIKLRLFTSFYGQENLEQVTVWLVQCY